MSMLNFYECYDAVPSMAAWWKYFMRPESRTAVMARVMRMVSDFSAFWRILAKPGLEPERAMP